MQGFKQTCKAQVELGVSASRLWATIKEGSKLLPKIAPEHFSYVKILQGQVGEIGSITLTKLGSMSPGGEEELLMKEQLLEVDDQAMTMKITEVEGGHIAVGFTKWQPTVKLVPLGPERVILRSTVEFEGDLDPTIAIALHMEAIPNLFRRVEKYLQETG
ncbi:hypothetical protein R1sor_026829 [Riccia sorocarpa]|uniref:Bet v I/Major latex protein domain-containing protein n=1 Tax=Riccia sorocarpa TaxID=122646 RepID=A0ABD3GE15_9MARC